MWHRDFPPDAREMWDVIAKAILIRCLGHPVTFTTDELRAAAAEQAEIHLHDDGSIGFRIEQH